MLNKTTRKLVAAKLSNKWSLFLRADKPEIIIATLSCHLDRIPNSPVTWQNGWGSECVTERSLVCLSLRWGSWIWPYG